MEGDVPCAIAAQVTAISWPPEQSCGCFPNCGSHRLEKPKAVFKSRAVLILSGIRFKISALARGRLINKFYVILSRSRQVPGQYIVRN